MGEGNTCRPVNDCNAGIKIANERFFIDTVAIAKRIAIEKDVARDGAAVNTGKQIPGNTIRRVERAEPGCIGPDQRRSVISIE